MKRQLLKGPVAIYVDVCDTCQFTWFDAGELAIAQLMSEASRKGQHQEAIMKRAAALEASPERKQELEDNLKKMPEGFSYEKEFSGDLADEVLKHILIYSRPFF